MIEYRNVICPSCWEKIELTLDLSSGSDTYSEDCSVCCEPMTVHLLVPEDGEGFSVEVEAENA